MNCDLINRKVISLFSIAFLSFTTQAQIIILDGFETDEGHFALAPTFSGTTTGVSGGTADRDLTQAFEGIASQRIFIDDNPAVDVAATTPVQAWRLRHLSGSGTPANNVTISATGFVGFYLQTTTPNLQASLMIDDGTALERASYIPIVADGLWHVYQWDFDDAASWEAFAGTGPNGAIDAASVTLDSVFISSIKTAGDQDAIFFLDNVSFNNIGQVPEPSTLALGVTGLLFLAYKKRGLFLRSRS